MKILVLGHRGMLGSACVKHFSQNHNVITVDQRISKNNCEAFIKEALKKQPDVVINCLGQIKQKYFDKDDMTFVNGIFPKLIVNSIAKNQLFVQPSTDCIFSGKKGSYSLKDTPDPVDVYGESKLLGEELDTGTSLIIRTSIVGIENQTCHSLLSWLLTQQKVKGYTNHYWSGLTTLEWCKSTTRLIESSGRGIQHLSTKKMSKYELLNSMKRSFKHDVEIEEIRCENQIDRSLIDTSVEVPQIQDQLDELYEWHRGI